MKTLFTSLLLLIGLSYGLAQQIDLTGQISIHNSRYRTGQIEHVAGASVEAAFAGATVSDAQGLFSLIFTGLGDGDNASLTIEKAGLEVVNDQDLLNVVLGRKSPLRVFLAPKGELAQRQTEYYEISLATLTARKDALIASLRSDEATSTRTLRELEQRLNREIANRFDAEDLLREQLEAAKARLPETVKRLAEVNLDFASDTYRQAHDLYLAGKIEAALVILDETTLAAKSQAVLDQLATIELGRQDYQLAIEVETEKARQLYASYALKADAYGLVFDYRNAVDVLRKGVDLLKAVKEEEDIELALSYGDLALLYRELGQFSDAFSWMKRNIDILEGISGSRNLQIASAYNLLALIYSDLYNFNDALLVQKRALSIKELLLEPNHKSIAASYNNLSLIYQGLRDYDKALLAQKKVQLIYEGSLEPNDTLIAVSYNNLSSIYQDLANYDDALLAQLKAIEIQEKILEKIHPDLAHSFNNLSEIYVKIGNYNKALFFQDKAIKILELIYEPIHPKLALAYNNLAGVHRSLGNFEKALKIQKKSLTIHMQISPITTPDLASCFGNLSLIYQKLDDYDNALIFMVKSIRTEENFLPVNKNKLADSYGHLATIYMNLGNFESALSSQRICLNLREEIYSPNDENIARTHYNMGHLYYFIGRLDSAIFYLENSYRILSEHYTGMEQKKQAIRSDLSIIYVTSGNQKQFDGLHKSARRDFTNALFYALNSLDSAIIYNSIGLCYYHEGKHGKAIKAYTASYELSEQEEWIYLNNTGMAYAKWGKLAVAKERFTKLEQLLPNTGLPFRDWGLYYYLTGEVDLALDNLEKAIRLGYNNWDWLRTEEALGPLRDHPRFKALLAKAPNQKD